MTGPEHAGDGEDRNASRASRGGHRLRELSIHALAVDAPLAGDDDRRAGELPIEADRVEHELRAGHEPRIEEGDESRPEATRGARARDVAHVPSDESLDDIGIPLERRIEV